MQVEKMLEPIAKEVLKKQLGTRITQMTDNEKAKALTEFLRSIRDIDKDAYSEINGYLLKTAISQADLVTVGGRNMLKIQSVTLWRSVVNCFFLSYPIGNLDAAYLKKIAAEFKSQSEGVNFHRNPDYVFKSQKVS